MTDAIIRCKTQNLFKANHAFELLSIFDTKHPAMQDFQFKIKEKNDFDWNISDLCEYNSQLF